MIFTIIYLSIGYYIVLDTIIKMIKLDPNYTMPPTYKTFGASLSIFFGWPIIIGIGLFKAIQQNISEE